MSRKDHIKALLAAVTLFVISFPRFEPDYGIGLDTSYVWAINYLFENDYSFLKKIIYPIGPLGILKMPTTEGDNFLYFLFFFSIAKISFLYLALYLSRKVNSISFSFSIPVLWLMSYFLQIDYILVGLSVLLSYLFIQEKKHSILALSVIVGSLGLYIKSSIGLSALCPVFVSLTWILVRERNFLNFSKYVLVALLSFIVIGFVVFGNFEQIYSYFIHVFLLSEGYNEALSLHPENDSYLIVTFFLLLLIPPIFVREQSLFQAFLLLLLPLFLMWKHAIIRQDISHMHVMTNFLVLFWGILILLSPKRQILLFGIAVCSLFVFQEMKKQLPIYSKRKIELVGFGNFWDWTVNYTASKEKFTTISLVQIDANRFSDSILAIIDQETIDFYPWELSFVPANNFNWKPRKTLQSGAYSHWLDLENVRSFTDEDSPKWIFLHHLSAEKGKEWHSIDERYLLNDNPLFILHLFKNYQAKFHLEKGILLEKSSENLLSAPEYSDWNKTTWNQWVDVSAEEDEIVRIQVKSKPTLLGKWVNFTYKTGAHYVEYEFSSGERKTFRYIPGIAEDGLWLHPFIQYPSVSLDEPKVKRVRFFCKTPEYVEDEVAFRFENISLLHYSKTKSGREMLLRLAQIN